MTTNSSHHSDIQTAHNTFSQPSAHHEQQTTTTPMYIPSLQPFERTCRFPQDGKVTGNIFFSHRLSFHL